MCLVISEIDALALFSIRMVLLLSWYILLCYTMYTWASMECFTHETNLSPLRATINYPSLELSKFNLCFRD